MFKHERGEDPRFWKDEFFFKSRDPIEREKEIRFHPDSGERVLIIERRLADLVAKLAAEETKLEKEEETSVMYYPSQEIGKN
jgi:hypothetical protein